MDTFDGRLAQALEARGLKPRDLYVTHKILSKAAVYFLLNGTTTRAAVRDTTVDKLCSILRVNRAWLTENKGPRDVQVQPTAIHKTVIDSTVKVGRKSELGHVRDDLLLAAEHLLAAYQLVHGDLTPRKRARTLAKIYNLLFDDGGTLSRDHLAELNLEDVTRGTTRKKGRGRP